MHTLNRALGWTIASALETLRPRLAAILSWLERQAAASRSDDPLRGLPSQIRGDIGLCDGAERALPRRAEASCAFPDLPSSTLVGR